MLAFLLSLRIKGPPQTCKWQNGVTHAVYTSVKFSEGPAQPQLKHLLIFGALGSQSCHGEGVGALGVPRGLIL